MVGGLVQSVGLPGWPARYDNERRETAVEELRGDLGWRVEARSKEEDHASCGEPLRARVDHVETSVCHERILPDHIAELAHEAPICRAGATERGAILRARSV